MTNPLSPTPNKAAQAFALERPARTGVVCVLSEQPAGRGGRNGLRSKETRFRIAAGKAEAFRPQTADEFHEPVDWLLDIRALQLGTDTQPALTLGPVQTPAQKRDLAQAAWWKGVNERLAQRRLVQAAGPVVIIPASGD